MQVTGTEYWSAINNKGINAAATGFTEDLGFYNSQGQWFQTLGTKIQKLSNITFIRKLLEVEQNFLVCSPAVGTILESIPGYAADSDGDVSAAKLCVWCTKSRGFKRSLQSIQKPIYD